MFLRKANSEDMLDVFNWRNDTLTRKMSVHGATISRDTHKEWFQLSLEKFSCQMYIGITENIKVGICRFDENNQMKTSEVSITINPAMRGKKLSSILLTKSIEFYKLANNLTLTATIKKENISSLKIFHKCGFVTNTYDDHFYYLSLQEVYK